MKQNEWKKKVLDELRDDAARLIRRIDEADLQQYVSKRWAAVKRSGLDLQRTGAKLRRGFFNKESNEH